MTLRPLSVCLSASGGALTVAALALPLLAPAAAAAQPQLLAPWQAPGWQPHPGWMPTPQHTLAAPPSRMQQPLMPGMLLGVQEQAQRCNTGRLVGGLVGGGAAYGLAKGSDRVWATPLGALLGSQMGCNAAQGQGLRLW